MSEPQREDGDVPDLEWISIAARIAVMRHRVEPKLRDMMSFVGTTGGFCRKLVRQTSASVDLAMSEKIATASCIQAFRTAVSVIELSLAGYADIAASLVRTIWELHIRLNRIRDDGEIKALAYMHHAVEREIEIRNRWLKQAVHPSTRLEEEETLATWLVGKQEIEDSAARQGVSAKELKQLGSERLVNAAEKAHLEDEYLTWHAAMSQITHGGSAAATYDDLMNYVDEGSSILLPIDSHAQYMIAHALTNTFAVMCLAAEILGELETMHQIALTNQMLGRIIERTMAE